MSYEEFDPDDFAQDDLFRKWVFDPSPEANQFWTAFQQQHPTQQEAIRQARALLLLFNNEMDRDLPSREQVATMWNRVEAHVNKPVWVKWSAPVVLRWVAAASLLIGLIYIALRVPRNIEKEQTIYQQLTQKTATPLQEVQNNTRQPMQVQLPDKSVVWLSAKSRVSFPKSFAGVPKRDVYLTGRAFFSVTKNSKQPFFVYANELVTKVLGTSFWVNAYETGKEVVVTVESGRVSVFARNDRQAERMKANRELEGVVLTPNQQVRFSRSEVRMQKSLVAEPKIVVPTAPIFSFRDAPVSQVFDALEQAYGVDIVYDEDALSHCLLTASLTQESLFEKLDLICKGIEAHYQLVDGQIVILSQGCR